MSSEQIRNILKKLQLKPIEIVRKNEAIWKEKYKGKDFTDDQLIEILSNEPKLIERPIIVSEKLAVIGRPAENIDKLLWCLWHIFCFNLNKQTHEIYSIVPFIF